MQTLLQSQPLSTSPLDLVLEAVELLSVLQDHVPTALASNDDEVANLMVLVCGFLQEMVQVRRGRSARAGQNEAQERRQHRTLSKPHSACHGASK